MPTTGSSSVQGLASGIQWQDLVDSLANVDKQRELDPITARITKSQAKETAWNAYSSQAQALTTAVAALRDGSAIDSFQVGVMTSATTGKSLLSANATSAATPGSYQVEVVSLAKAEKLSGGAFASSSTALGFAGDFAVDGMKVSVLATDSLSGIRDKINALNTGTNPSGVTASVLGTANGSMRLVLSSDAAGSHGIELVDSTSASGVLQQLGLLDGTYAGGTNADGTGTSGAFSSANVAVGQLLGLTPPGATDIRVGNRTVSVDLGTDTLTTIAAKITAAGIAANTVSTTDSAGITRTRLQVGAGFSAIPSVADNTVPDANSQRVLQMLGVLQGGRSSVAQVLGSTALTDSTNAIATGATLLTGVKANGATANIQSGDTVTVLGKRGDGTAVSFNLAVGAGTTLNDLVSQLNGVSGFGGGARAAVASIDAGGRLHLTDGTAGDSLLTLSMVVNKSAANGGGSTSIGAFGTDTLGRTRQVSQGSDAQVRIDGTLLTRSSNSISDAITGLSLSLERAEVGTAVTVDVQRQTAGALNAVKGFATAYNALIAFVKKNTAVGGALANNTALKASASSFTNVLLQDVVGSTITRGALIGVALDKTGVLQVDETAFTAAMKNNPAGVKSLFALSGSATGTGLSFVGSTDKTVSGAYNVVITQAATQASTTGSASTFPYVSGGAANHLTLTDAATGTTSSLLLVNGDDASAIAARLNTMFSTSRMKLAASVSGGQLAINSTQYGSSGGFTIAFDTGDATSATQLGLTAGPFAGLNVGGTINGAIATGLGQSLTGAAGDATEGLALFYSGTATGAIGTTTISTGLAEQMARKAASISLPGSGMVASSIAGLDRSIATDTTRSADVADRLARRKSSLLKQFSAMESAIQRIQQQGTSLTASLNSLTSLQSNK